MTDRARLINEMFPPDMPVSPGPHIPADEWTAAKRAALLSELAAQDAHLLDEPEETPAPLWPLPEDV